MACDSARRNASRMFRSARQLEDFELRARDGRIGHVTDFYFDDRRWTVRYFVVDTGRWLDHREVLIAPGAVRSPDWEQRLLPVDLTQEQVRGSPPIESEEPVSPEQELALIQYYNWPAYWGAPGFADTLVYTPPPFLPVRAAPDTARREASTLDTPHHIRSVEDVRGHRIEANDGELGYVDDFLIDDVTWRIGFLVVETRHWWPGKRVLVAPEWAYEIGWDEARVYVDLAREEIKHSPPYDPAQPVAADYVDQLHAHYAPERRAAEP
jgi:uncharacterized protein YrrD